MAETQTTESAADIMKAAKTASEGALEVRSGNTSVADQDRIKALMGDIDMASSTSIISFGTEAQKGLSARSDEMLKGVRNKDTGPAGEVMNGLMTQIRGLGLDDLNPNEKPGFFAKMMSKLSPLQKFIQSYEGIESQVDSMVSKLEGEQRKLSRDIVMLDGMYDDALVFFNELAWYIQAGEDKLEEVRTKDIPALATKAEESSEMLDAQALRDMTERANDLERKTHDLKLTRQVTMQMLPQIRMIQDVDKGLVTKISSSILTTIPLWKTQIAMAITIWNQAGATKTVKAVTDATNDMLTANSKLLRQSTGDARKEIERGVVDIETVKQVNADLIATIQESIQIAKDGQAARIQASADLIVEEQKLKDALRDAAGTTAHAASDSLGA